MSKKLDFILSNKEITNYQEYEERFEYLLWHKDYDTTAMKRNYEFVINYHGIKRIEGDRR